MILAVKTSLASMRYHLRTYIGAAILVFLVSFYCSSALSLYYAYKDGIGIRDTLDSDTSSWVADVQLEQGTMTLRIMLMVAAFVNVFLIYSIARQLITTRIKEIANLKLLGASIFQITRTLLREMLILGGAVSIVGALAGAPFSHVLYSIMLKSGLVSFPKTLFGDKHPVLQIGFYPLAIVTVIVIVLATLTLGVLFSMNLINRSSPLASFLEFPKSFKLLSKGRLIVGLASIPIVLSILYFGTKDPGKQGPIVLFLGAALLLVPIIILGPVLVHLISSIIAYLFRGLAPSAILIAKQRSHKEGNKLAATVIPLVISVSLVGIFNIVAQGGSAQRIHDTRGVLKASLVGTKGFTNTVKAKTQNDKIQKIDNVAEVIPVSYVAMFSKVDNEVVVGSLGQTKMQSIKNSIKF